MKLTYKFSDLDTSDIENIASCEAKHFSDACSGKALSSLLAMGAIAVTAYDGDTLCGFGYLSVAPGEGELLRIAVNEDHRGCGIGKEILSILHKRARALGCGSVFLEVRESNLNAIGLYESMGYTRIGIRKGFYKAPREDAFLYKKDLI